jgi:Ca-activated chloride channel family protein
MRRTTNFFRLGLLSALIVAMAATCVWVGGAHAQQQQTPPPVNPSVPPPPPGSRPQGKQAPGVISNVDFVVLHAAVLDRQGVFVDGLPAEVFRVFEDKIEQKLSVARQEDVPVSMGIVVDNSGSMREKRAKVNAAALTFVKTSNPNDEGFVVNFSDEFYLDTEHDFTSDINEMKEALNKIDSRGATALYDAIIGSVDHLKKAKKDKRVLLVITDGEDNMSRNSLAKTIEVVQHSDAVIYAVGLYGKDENKSSTRKARKALQDLAEATGGLAFFPDDVSDTETICTQIAHDIRNQYTLAYYPTNFKRDGTFRAVQVEVIAPKGRGKLTVRTRTGYYAKTAPAGN